MKISAVFSNVIFMVYKALFSMLNIIKWFIKAYFKDKRTESKFEIFDQNHWLTGAHNPGYGLLLVNPFEKMKVF